MKYENLTYRITTDYELMDDQNQMTPELSHAMEKCHKMALSGKKSAIRKIKNAIEKYPNKPQFKNFLSVLYGQMNETQKMFDVNRWIIAEHPNYLFGKLNLANEYFTNGEYDKIPEVLGQDMELSSLYPDRKIFHLNEVCSYLKSVILYYSAIGNLVEAEIRYEFLEELSPDSHNTQVALHYIIDARIKANHKRFEECEKTRISVNVRPQEITTVDQAPSFNHPEINDLYEYDLKIEKEKLESLLSLPQKTLIQDLESVLEDSINRYTYFQKTVEQFGEENVSIDFVIHAIYILSEIQASESIRTIFKVLSQSKEYSEFYLGDFTTEVLWEPLFKVASNNLQACKAFLFKPGTYTYARSCVTDMVEQIALHQPQRRDEILQWFNELIQFYLNSKIEDNVIDSDFIAFIVCNLIDIDASSLLPEIKKMFEKGIVSKDVCGSWEEINYAFAKNEKKSNKREILSIYDRYNQIISTWSGYNEDVSPVDFDDDLANIVSKPRLTGRKIGRNEPCPCGSGNKYKKCCLKKKMQL